MLVIVFRCRPAASAKPGTVQWRAARAIRSCALVTGIYLCYCHMRCYHRHPSMLRRVSVMPALQTHKTLSAPGRRHFIGGSDAPVVMGHDEGALLRLWRDKRGKGEPHGSSSHLYYPLW